MLRSKKHSAEQIIAKLRTAEAGISKGRYAAWTRRRASASGKHARLLVRPTGGTPF